MLQSRGDELILTVEDDGRGFGAYSAAAQHYESGGYGLFSIRERLRLYGGRLDIDDGAAGSRVSLRLPLAALSGAPGGSAASVG